ncbi:MAG: HAMP domain-containing histidine kinase [Chitinophaga sp.]|uniref:sensor histidine kinase n=1 Tax=Chitinophaga sp. TaxID=1869181 RepID=UPI0025C4C469|nr:HAMP domain-containing sensor histidine kinase [Chitinophaga sp.]MBV8253505.1 HAMP domain-containing histidine kinase [Chitinophaga sp.]
MKLLTRSTLYFLIIMLPIFAIGAGYLFKKFDKEIRHETDEELINDKIQWMRYLDTAKVDNAVLLLKTPEFSLTPTDQPIQQKPKLNGVRIYQEPEDSYAPFRELSQVISFHGHNYLLVMRKSQIEKDDLLKNIIHVMLLAFAGLLFFAILFNFIISKKVWRPFYDTLDKIRHLQLSKTVIPQFNKTKVHEFNQLNDALNSMTTRISQDYTTMKELTEDAAHEMQTPLAIVQGKLELLLQDDTLSEEQLKAITQSSDELQRLSRLNHNLLLIAKIENQQFHFTERTDMAAVTDKYLQLFDELMAEKQITIESDIQPANWQLHPALADILVSNLLGNAIKYNMPGGSIRVTLSATTLVITNSSDYTEIPESSLFQRFKKQQVSHSASNGLGLAICKKITDAAGLNISYHFQSPFHTFTVTAIS